MLIYLNVTQDECEGRSVVSWGEAGKLRAGKLALPFWSNSPWWPGHSNLLGKIPRIISTRRIGVKTWTKNIWSHLVSNTTVDGWNPEPSQILKTCKSSKGVLLLPLNFSPAINRPWRKEFPATRSVLSTSLPMEMYGLNSDDFEMFVGSKLFFQMTSSHCDIPEIQPGYP